MSDTRAVFNIQRFSLNDGPGIRTTVFLKGCMLRCAWCHNPESKSPHPQLLLHRSRCIGCGACMSACPSGFHHITKDGNHTIDRIHCTLCGMCVSACIGAIEIVGTAMTVEEILHEVEKDRTFYDTSGGGMTVSGGEPLLTPDFTFALLRGAKERGFHTCIETCGYADYAHIAALLPYTDLFLWDVKETDDERHRAFTGVSGARIRDNLRRLSEDGGQIVLRCPLIPGYNVREAHLLAIADLAESIPGVIRVDVEPYHPLGRSKSEDLDEIYLPGDLPMTEAAMADEWVKTIASHTIKPVQKA